MMTASSCIHAMSAASFSMYLTRTHGCTKGRENPTTAKLAGCCGSALTIAREKKRIGRNKKEPADVGASNPAMKGNKLMIYLYLHKYSI